VDCPLLGLPNRLIVGFDFLHEDVDRKVVSSDEFFGTFTTVSDLTRDVYGVFLQDELSITGDLLLAAGFRFDRADLDLRVADDSVTLKDRPSFDVWSPKASITYRLSPSASAYFSYARGFRLPNFDEDAQILFIPGEPLTLPDLDPQISDAFEIGAKVRSERVDASLALYHMEVKNEITLNPTAFRNENFDRVRHRGIESSFAAWILEWLAVYATYTFEDVEIRRAEESDFEGRRIPITPKHRGTLGVFARFPYDLELTANANFVGERIVSNDFDRQVDALDRYATLDLLFAWRPKFGEHVDGALTFALRNVNDERYADFAARSSFPPYVAGFYPAAKRTWEVGLMLTVRM
jgi:outer membrane receptor protein involved in Fe transport